ncbi:D-amino acid aminotransferase [Rhodoferax sp. 4810]|nr:D-amino acid aminotransferase [Rhodoferax jenense]
MHTLPALPCYLNGEFTTLPHAKISVMDRGFIFGDGVYEVVPVYGGQLFRFAQHMARLERSLRECRISNPLSREQWADIAFKLIADYADATRASALDLGFCQNTDQLIYIQVTRGVAMRDHVMPTDITPTVFVMTNVMKPPSAEQRAQGVACVSADDFRWEKAHIKATSLLGAVFARQISFDAGALETVMFRDGFLSEAAASNVWVVKDGQLLGTPKDHLVLEGIRYGLIEEICAAQGIPFELRRISRAEVLAADEILLSSATKEVLPVTLLDGQPVGSGQPGPVYARLYAGYQAAKAAARAASVI